MLDIGGGAWLINRLELMSGVEPSIVGTSSHSIVPFGKGAAAGLCKFGPPVMTNRTATPKVTTIAPSLIMFTVWVPSSVQLFWQVYVLSVNRSSIGTRRSAFILVSITSCGKRNPIAQLEPTASLYNG